MKILAIGAHPDDIELGCMGTLLKYATYGHAIHSLILTNGGNERAEESKAAFKEVGLKDPVFCDLEDGRLDAHQLELIQTIESQIHQVNPAVVLFQTKWDTHQDHRAVETAVLSATRRRPLTLLGYHAISSTPSFPVNMAVDVTAVLERKIKCLEHHRSQQGKSYFDPDWLRDWHREKMATAVGIKSVELFHVFQTFL